jgi:hypothetical protein
METEPETLVDAKRLEAVYGNPRSWWYAAAETGRVPSFKVGKYRRFRLSQIEAWLATTHKPAEPPVVRTGRPRRPVAAKTPHLKRKS